LDIERFKDVNDEPMSSVGMAAKYTKTSDGKILRNITESNNKQLDLIYDQYHSALTELVIKAKEKWGKVLIVDCHSFPSAPRIYESDQEINRPDICIGIDDFHTPSELVKVFKEEFEKQGFSVKINSPFSGTIVPMNFYLKDKDVNSIMIEVNRRLYMNEVTFEKSKEFNQISNQISRVVIVNAKIIFTT
jgi:N-formylglutamate amidohydrolase